MNKKEREKQKTIFTFGWASFLNDLGAEMINPIWPLLITVYLGASTIILGFIDGLGEAVVSFSQVFSGYFSDKTRKRKVFIASGYSLASLSRVGYMLSHSWQAIIPFRILDRAGKIRDAPRDAIVADISRKKERGKNFGIIRAMDNLGALFGIVISVVLFAAIGLHKLLLLAAIPSFIAVILIICAVKEKKSVQRNRRVFSLRKFDRNFRLFLLVSSVFALGSFSYSFLLIYSIQQGFSQTAIPLLYLIFTFIASVANVPFGALSDKVGRRKIIGVAYLFWICAGLSFIFAPNYLFIIFGFVLYGLHKGALDPVQKSFVAELSPKGLRASGLGISQMFIGFCALPASLAAGFLWEFASPVVPFIISLCLTLVSFVLLFFVKEKKEKQLKEIIPFDGLVTSFTGKKN